MTATTESNPRPIRVLVAKPGLDGHDVGAKLVCRALADAGMEVIYTGLRQSPEAIARAALEENVDVVGLSILSGAHEQLARKVLEQLRASGEEPPLVLVGGNIPRPDHASMREMGVAAVFPTGTRFDEIVKFLQQEVTR